MRFIAFNRALGENQKGRKVLLLKFTKCVC